MSWPWSELGLDGPASLDEVRRAYARRVKEVHPEEDPEGFQRLHTAYQAARQAARRAGRGTPQGPPDFTGKPETPRPSRPEPGEEAPKLDFSQLLHEEKPQAKPEEPRQKLDFRALLDQEDSQKEPREKKESRERWDFQRLLQEEERRRTEEQRRQYGGEQGGAVARALQLVRLLFEEQRPRSDWERFLRSGLFFLVKEEPQFMDGLAEAFRAGPVHNPKIREDVLLAYGLQAGKEPKKHRAFYSAVSGQAAETWTTRGRRFRQRHPFLFRAAILVDGILLLLAGFYLGDYFSQLPYRQQAETICQYIEEDFGFPAESCYGENSSNPNYFYLPVQQRYFVARLEGERDLSRGEPGYTTDLAGALVARELEGFAEEWEDVCELKTQSEESGDTPPCYRISFDMWDGAEAAKDLSSRLDSLSQETWYKLLAPAYQLQLEIRDCPYYTYTAPEESFDAAAMADSYQTQARPALIRYLLEESGLGQADFGDTPYQLVDLGVITIYTDDFIQIGGVNETTGETDRLYFYDGMCLISTPAESFDPNMDGFAYIDFIYSDHFESAAERSSHADLLLWDVVRH